MDRLIELALSNAANAALLALAVAMISRFVRRPGVLHVLWLLVLLRLLAPPVLEIPLLPAPPASDTVAAPSQAVPPILAGAVPLRAERWQMGWQELVALLWFAGAILIAGLALLRVRRVRHMLADAEPPPPWLQSRVAALATRLGVIRPPRTVVVDAPVSPMLWSPLVVPLLILPRDLLGRLAGDENDALIAHELAHVRRRDYLVRHLELAVAVVFWWHPVTWWACRQLRLAEEECCDALVTRALPDHARAYAGCLIKTMQFLAGARLTAPLVAASGVGNLREVTARITAIMTRRFPASLSPAMRVALCLTVLVVLVLSPTLAARRTTTTAALAGLSREYTGEPITLTLADANLRNVLLRFSVMTGYDIVLDPQAVEDGLLNTPVSCNAVSKPWDQVLDELLAGNNLGFTREGSLLWVHPVDRGPGDGRSFTGEPISLQLANGDIRDVLKTFSKLTGLAITAAPDVSGSVSVDIKDVPWDQALDLILRVNGLGYTYADGSLQVHRVSGSSGELLSHTPPPESARS